MIGLPRALAMSAAILCGGCGVAELALPRPFHLSRAHVDARPAGVGLVPEVLPWVDEVPSAIVVDRESKALVLYEDGNPVGRFRAVFGRVPGRKQHEGDRKTPSGIYRVTRKRPHYKFHKFLDIDYPNAEDLRRYREALARGDVPKRASGGRVGPGRLVGIHGSDDERLNDLGIDWTLGCVSLRNDDVDVLYRSVDEGTLVVIQRPPAESPPVTAADVPVPPEDEADPRAGSPGTAARHARATPGDGVESAAAR